MARIEFIARIISDDGSVIGEKKIEGKNRVPEPSEIDLRSREGLLETFDRYEKVLLDTRNKAEPQSI